MNGFYPIKRLIWLTALLFPLLLSPLHTERGSETPNGEVHLLKRAGASGSFEQPVTVGSAVTIGSTVTMESAVIMESADLPRVESSYELSAASADTGETTDAPVDSVITSVADGFEVQLLYEVPRQSQGSWVSLAVTPDGDLMATDQRSGSGC